MNKGTCKVQLKLEVSDGSTRNTKAIEVDEESVSKMISAVHTLQDYLPISVIVTY